LGKEHNITFHSVAAGGILNKLPLATEPQSAIYVIDAIEAAEALGAKNILLAFFGNGDLRRKDLYGNLRDLRDGDYASYELNTKHVQRVVETLKQVVPRAEDAGVYIGLENTLSTRQNLDIIDQIGSEMVKVYYDVGNSWNFGYDVPGELRMLGNEMICEIHLKDRKTKLLGSQEAEVDMHACAEVLKEIEYDKWLVLETSGRPDKFEEDTITNVAFVRKTFSMN
jgi:sugar phosphate isomerase/epimerase